MCVAVCGFARDAGCLTTGASGIFGWEVLLRPFFFCSLPNSLFSVPSGVTIQKSFPGGSSCEKKTSSAAGYTKQQVSRTTCHHVFARVRWMFEVRSIFNIRFGFCNCSIEDALFSFASAWSDCWRGVLGGKGIQAVWGMATFSLL